MGLICVALHYIEATWQSNIAVAVGRFAVSVKHIDTCIGWESDLFEFCGAVKHRCSGES